MGQSGQAQESPNNITRRVDQLNANELLRLISKLRVSLLSSASSSWRKREKRSNDSERVRIPASGGEPNR